jgi:RNA polymerase sigma-70 factor (ECF subfamily)
MNVAEPSHAALFAAAKLGDRTAFSDLITEEYQSAFRLAFALLHDVNGAEDAVQEAAFKAWRKIDQLRDGAPFRPWLLGIVANECRSMARGRWWSVVRTGEVRTTSAAAPAEENASFELRTALKRLPHDERLILILRYYIDLPYDEIAEHFGISSKAARTRTERALKRLRPLLRLQEVIA